MRTWLGEAIGRVMVAAMVATAIPMGSSYAQTSNSATVPEVRADVIAASRTTMAQLGAGLNFGSAGYGRVAFVAAAGTATRAGRTRESARIDAAIRFHLDPYRLAKWGAYAQGGLSGLYNAFDGWRALVSTTIGIEMPTRGHTTWALEAGLGGGVRLGAVLRRARPDSR
jgi:hypothetical protein